MTDLVDLPQPSTEPPCLACGQREADHVDGRCPMYRPRRRVVITGNACCGGNGVEASCEVCRD